MKKHARIKRGQETCALLASRYASRHAVMEYRATVGIRELRKHLSRLKNIESREIFAASSQLVDAMALTIITSCCIIVHNCSQTFEEGIELSRIPPLLLYPLLLYTNYFLSDAIYFIIRYETDFRLYP